MQNTDPPSLEVVTEKPFVKRPRKWFAWGAAAVVIVGVGAGGLFWRGSASASEGKTPEPEKVIEFAASDLVKLGPRQLGRVISVSGSINPVTSATVKSKVAAEVARIHVQEGERVAAGQLLLTLDTGDLKARLDAQQAAVSEARARLDLATKTQASNRQLLSQNFISQTAFDTAQNSVDVAQASLNAALAQLDIARRALGDSQVRAPFSGVVAKRLTNAGEKVSPDVPLLVLVDLSRMELQAQVPVSEIPYVKVGQALDLSVDGFDKRFFKGLVGRINPATEAGTRAISVFVALPNADGALRGGMFAKGSIVLNSDASTNALPLVAVNEEAGQSFVFLIRDGKIERAPVQLGPKREDLGLVEVRDGPAVGTDIVAVKAEGMKSGVRAVVKAAASK